MKRKECVYFIKQRGLTPVKIGYTSESTPSKRIKSLETAAPYGIDLLGFISTGNGLELERRLHKFFKKKRVNNEWFDITENQVEAILFCYGINKPITNDYIFSKVLKDNLTFDTRIYNYDLKVLFNGDFTGRKLMIELQKYCDINNIEILKGRDSERYFTLKQK